MGRESQAHTLVPNFTDVTIKMWACSLKNQYFWYKHAQKGYIPLSDFY